MRVLVTAASRHASTTAIAEAIGRAISEAGLQVELRNPELVGDIAGYDAVVLGSGVYYGKWLPAVMEFADRHRAALRSRPLWLFSSGPLGSPDLKPAGDPEGVAPLVSALEPREHRVFPGSLDRKRLGVGERLIVTAVHAQEGDFRDWETVAAWGRAIAADLAAEAPRAAVETAATP